MPTLAETESPAARLAAELASATVAVAIAAALAIAAERWLHLTQPGLVLVTAVVFVGVRARRRVSVYAALLCFLAYNYLFIAPRYSLYVAAPEGVAALVLFLLVALACGGLAARLQAQVTLLRAANARAAALQVLGRQLTAAVDERDAVSAAADALHAAVGAELAVLAEDAPGSGLVERGAAPRIDSSLHAAAARCWANAAAADARHAPAGSEPAWHCVVLGAASHPIGVAALHFQASLPHVPPDSWPLVEAMLRDLGQALARLRLAAQLEAARVQGESERMRAALLSSVSHDLRSPLSTIIGSADSLVLYSDRLSADDRLALARDIAAEGTRMDRYVQNLLDMTRVGPGAPAIEREWIGLDELGGALLARARRAWPGADLRLDLPEPAPLLHVHPSLVEQALFNILDNAVKFAPAGTPITLAARCTDGSVALEVHDAGPGIPTAERERIFERFYSAERGDRGGAGSGLGLTIAQAIAVAHGGELQALAPVDGIGARLQLRLPLAVTPMATGADAGDDGDGIAP